mgnify:CR=1 FL=1
MLQNRKKQLGTTAFNALRKKIAAAKSRRKNQIEMGEVSDRLSENLPPASLRKSGGRVGAPKGTGAALRGFGKGYK